MTGGTRLQTVPQTDAAKRAADNRPARTDKYINKNNTDLVMQAGRPSGTSRGARSWVPAQLETGYPPLRAPVRSKILDFAENSSSAMMAVSRTGASPSVR